jgi:hypothetical protein
VLVLSACGSGGSGAEPATLSSEGLEECGFRDEAVARIDVSVRFDIYHPSEFGRVEALVRDGPLPSFHRVAHKSGDCRYWYLSQGFCDPACASGEICDAKDECVVLPFQLSAGTLSVDGLAEPIEVSAQEFGVGSYDGPGGLDETLFAAGDSITASFSGDEFPRVSLSAQGVDAMEHELTDTGFDLGTDSDVELSWAPSDNEACVRVVLNSSNVSHGAPLDGFIECETSDTGSLTISQTLIERFPYGTTPEVTEGFDWPQSELTRYTASRVDTEYGPAELVVRSTTYFQVSHEP